LFLDPALTPVYDFFQYWRNVTDADVHKFFLLFTFLPVSEIDALVSGDINAAKERLAYEITAAIHGTAEADKALAGAKAAFGGGGDRGAMPTHELSSASFAGDGISLIDLLFDAKLAATKSDARRLVQQGGAYTVAKNGAETQITDVSFKVTAADFDASGEIVLRAGKKKFCRIINRA
jgi:tyrosyl-tRNA synthetase